MNSFAGFKPEPTESKLINKKEIIHSLFADNLCLYFTGYKMCDVGPTTVPRENSLAYRALAKSYKYAKFTYGYPSADSKQITHFETNPVVYLIRGPNKSTEQNPFKGLEFFTNKGIVPTMTILNNYFNPMNIRFLDCPEKKGGSVWMIFDAENFVMPERPRRKPVAEEDEPTEETAE